jgi:hypothetical protein
MALIAPKPADDDAATPVAPVGNGKMTPLQYMLAVINDPGADSARRDRLAIAAAPFCHEKIGERPLGKKDQAQARANSAGEGSDWGEDLLPMPPPGVIHDAEIRAN